VLTAPSGGGAEIMRSAAPAMIMSYSRRYDGGGSGRKTQLLHAQSEPLSAGREHAFAAEAEARAVKAPDRFLAVLRPVDFRTTHQVRARCQPPEENCCRVRSRADFYASSPLARRIADLKSLPTADQSPLRPLPGYRGVSVCAEPKRVEAPNPRISPEKKPPDVDRRPTTPPLRLRL
jgi:hypothetical protein